MKYIDAEKIRSEVERIKEAGCESPISVCNDILSFIDFLQQEQPEKNEESKHAEVWVEGRTIFEQDAKKPEVDLEKEIRKHTDLFQADIEYPLRLTAIKFYELGRKARKEE